MQHLSFSFSLKRKCEQEVYALGEEDFLLQVKNKKKRGVCYTKENALYILWCDRIIMIHVLGKDGADNAPAEMFNSSLFVSDEVLRIEGVLAKLVIKSLQILEILPELVAVCFETALNLWCFVQFVKTSTMAGDWMWPANSAVNQLTKLHLYFSVCTASKLAVASFTLFFFILSHVKIIGRSPALPFTLLSNGGRKQNKDFKVALH